MNYTTNYGWNMPEPEDPVNSSEEYANNMESIDNELKDVSDLADAVDQGLTALATTVAGKVNKNGDTMTGDLNMGNHKITNLHSPTSDGDATNKKFVEDKLEDYFPVSGGTLTGKLTAAGGSNGGINGVTGSSIDEEDITSVPNIQWVYNRILEAISEIDKFLPINGSEPMQGNIDMADNDIIDVDNLEIATLKPKSGETEIKSDGDLNMQGADIVGVQKITGLLTSAITNNGDATSKKFVEDKIAELISANEFTVNFTFKQGALTKDKTYTEIMDAVSSGKTIKAYHNSKNPVGNISSQSCNPLIFVSHFGGDICFLFITGAYSSDGGLCPTRRINISSDDTMTFASTVEI